MSHTSDSDRQSYTPEMVNALIRERRSVFPRQYDGSREVEEHIIRQILENANWAPTHKFTEPWRFVVFRGQAKDAFGETQAELYKAHTVAEQFSPEKYEKMKGNAKKSSHVIAILMHRDEQERLPEVEEISAVACAVQNMYLTATAYGLGAFWSTGGITYMPEAKELFGLGEKDRVMGFFYIGYPKEPVATQGKRGAVEEKITWGEI